MCLPVKPFRVEKEWRHAGLMCCVVLAREARHRCGYVRVPPSHPMHGKTYDDLDVEVHGGVIFAALEPCRDHDDGQGYWFGFDCAHLGDAPYDPDVSIEKLTTREARDLVQIRSAVDTTTENSRNVLQVHLAVNVHYWTVEEVVAETERLAEQLSALVPQAA